MIYKTLLHRVFTCNTIRNDIFSYLDNLKVVKLVSTWFWSRSMVSFVAFRSTIAPQYMLNILSRLPNLKRIDATGTRMTWDILYYIMKELKNIEYVVLDKCNDMDIPVEFCSQTNTDRMEVVLTFPTRYSPLVVSVKESWRLIPFTTLEPKKMLPLVIKALYSGHAKGIEKVQEIFVNDWSAFISSIEYRILRDNSETYMSGDDWVVDSENVVLDIRYGQHERCGFHFQCRNNTWYLLKVMCYAIYVILY